jgi:hypothetical protein
MSQSDHRTDELGALRSFRSRLKARVTSDAAEQWRLQDGRAINFTGSGHLCFLTHYLLWEVLTSRLHTHQTPHSRTTPEPGLTWPIFHP